MNSNLKLDELLDYQRILGRDEHDGPCQAARLNAISDRVRTHFPAATAAWLYGLAAVAFAALIVALVLGTSLTAWASNKLAAADAPIPAVLPNVQQGTFFNLVKGAVSGGQRARTTRVADILAPAAPGAQDDISAAYASIAAGKVPASAVAMPSPGAQFPGDAIAYKLVTVGDEKIMFAAVLVKASDFQDALWLGVVHTVAGKPQVCNFAPTELARYPGALVRAPQAKCDVTERMIPRAVSAAFGTPISSK
jgi:hypothetical protein